MPDNTCPICKFYDAPGFAINAWEIVPCWECNPGNYQGLAYPETLTGLYNGSDANVDTPGQHPTDPEEKGI